MDTSYRRKFNSTDSEAYRDLIEHHADADERTSAIDLGDTADEQITRYRQITEDMMREGRV